MFVPPLRVWFGVAVAIAGLFFAAFAGAADPAPATLQPGRPLPHIAAVPFDGSIHIDGRLDDAAWATAEPATEFTQRDPNEGQPASEKTEVRVLVGDEALYIGARMYDKTPAKIRARLVRRDDDLDSDFFVVFLDSNHDRTNAVLFRVNPMGCVNDAAVNVYGNQDNSWDPVWHAASTMDSLGWSTEIAIPLSQLHYNTHGDGVWGIQFRRFIYRTQELDEYSFNAKSEAWTAARFGELSGMSNLHSSRHFELMPYGRLRSEFRQVAGADPFRDGVDQFPAAGMDLKYGLTSNLTLNASLNPDFGEVEVDPAVVNLTAFETFYPEKRPFFVEGADIFRFGATNTMNNFNTTIPFHARRIGRSPHLTPSGADIVYYDSPARTTIAAAGKVTGKTSSGWTIGMLDALTPTERAEFSDTLGATGKLAVEPRTNYFVGRLQKDLRQGNTQIGGLFTAVNRNDGDPTLSSMLRRRAYVGGLDLNHYWHGRQWSFDANVLMSGLAGTTDAIASAQQSSARYYQRPDANYLTYDPTRTSLSGAAGLVSLNKTAGKHWRGSLTYQDWSPGFEINDLGFQNAADSRGASSLVMYTENKPGTIFRYYTLFTFSNESWNYGGDPTYIAHAFHMEGQLKNYWSGWVRGTWSKAAKDDRLTRGGPLSGVPAGGNLQARVDSDNRHSVTYGAQGLTSWDEAGGLVHSVSPYLSIRPSSAVRVLLEPGFKWNRDNAQYVQAVADPTATATFDSRYVFATLEQTTLNLDTRVDWTFSPRLSLQFYLQPLVVSGAYAKFKELRAPGEYEFDVYGQQRGTIADDGVGGFDVDPDGAGSATGFNIPHQDFNYRSLIGNAVLRWEYRPGSTLFVVWQHNRQETGVVGDFDFSRDIKRVFKAEQENVLAVKMTWWLGV